jgi:parallel beta-helix repeat protein
LAPSGSISVSSYGAVGNGQADDTAAIQAALDAGAGKVVFVPAGTYKVSGLQLRTATTLNLDAQARIVLAPASNGTLLKVSAKGAIVSGSGTLDGNRASQTNGAGIVVAAGGVSIRDVHVINTVTYGIYAANVDSLDISGVSVSGTGYIGIFAEATTGTLSNLVIENSRVDRTSEGTSIIEGGIKVHRSGSSAVVSGVTIRGNTVVMPQGPSDQTAIAIETWGGVQAAIIQNNSTSGGSIGVSLDRSNGGSVTGNTVSGASMYGIELASSANATASSNVVQCGGYTPRGIVLDNSGSTDDTVSGNTISGCTSLSVQLNPGSDRAVVSGNQISQNHGYAIDIIQSTGVSLTNNAADGTGGAAKAVMVDTSSGTTITGNRFSNFTENGVLLYASSLFVVTQVTITNNTFSHTNVAYGTQLSGGATLGTVAFTNNTIS